MAIGAILSLVLLQIHPVKPEISAWVVNYNPVSIPAFLAHADRLHDAMVTCVDFDKDGVVQPFRGWTDSDLRSIRATARKHHVRLFATVANSGGDDFDPVRMTKVLQDRVRMEQAIAALTKVTSGDQFDGIDLDIESLSATDRNAFSTFVERLGAALHKNKKLLSVTVHAKTEEPGNWSGPQAQDWKKLGLASDAFRIMCYDFSWSTSPPGPIAPTDWVVQVAKFAVSQVDLKKVDIGVAWYGYDWKVKPATSLIFADLPKSNFTLDPRSGERIYADTLHFAGVESFQEKVKALASLGITKFSAWYCGSGDPAVWK